MLIHIHLMNIPHIFPLQHEQRKRKVIIILYDTTNKSEVKRSKEEVKWKEYMSDYLKRFRNILHSSFVVEDVSDLQVVSEACSVIGSVVTRSQLHSTFTDEQKNH